VGKRIARYGQCSADPPPKLCGSANVGICHKRNRSSVGAAILTSGGKTLRAGTIREAGLGPPPARLVTQRGSRGES
jgi:hypothetical protein